MKKRIIISGLGIISSIGIGQRAFWNNLVKGTSGISEITAFDTSAHITHRGGETKNFNPEEFIDRRRLKFMSRGSQLTSSAIKLAIQDANLKRSELSKCEVGCCMGTTLGELPVFEKMDRARIKGGPLAVDSLMVYQFPTPHMVSHAAIEYKLKGPVRIFTTACAAGNYAIGFGYDLLQSGEAEIILAGGADACSWIPFTGFNQFRSVAPQKCQPFDKNRKGLLIGEGAGVVVLETLERALSRGASIYAEVLGYGLSCDAYHVTSTQEEGIYRCMKDALEQTQISRDSVDYICAHGTGTRQNDRAESAAIKRLFGDRFKHIPTSSIKSMLGHTMGAASAIEAISCCLTVKHDIIPPTINFEEVDPECDIDCVPNVAREKEIKIALNNGFAFGGNNACLVIQKYK